jgi:hypothetical protein
VTLRRSDGEMDEKCSTNGKYVNALHKIFVGKPEEKRPF